MFETLAATIKAPVSNSTDSKRLSLVVLRTVSRLQYDTVKPHIAVLAPVVFGNVRDPVIPVKLSAEQAFLATFKTVDEGDSIFEVSVKNLNKTKAHTISFYAAVPKTVWQGWERMLTVSPCRNISPRLRVARSV